MVEITPEIQAQLDEQKKSCIFCKIIARETDSKIVYEDDLIIAVLDVNPCAKGHILIMPKEHYPIMPYIPAATFQHMFGMISKIGKGVKGATASTGFNVFIANGGAAGQQSPHFLIHLFPREESDGIWKYDLSESKVTLTDEIKKSNEMLKNNIPIMMNNHFGRNPASWHVQDGTGEMPAHLASIASENEVVYEDEKSLVVLPKNQQCTGHLAIYSKGHQSHHEELDMESSSHLFYVASFCGTAVFEGLGAHGSNIILKSGFAQDNSSGLLEMHVLPRFSEDGIDVTPAPLSAKPDMDAIHESIKSGLFLIENEAKEGKKESTKEVSKEAVSDLDPNDPLYEVMMAMKNLQGK